MIKKITIILLFLFLFLVLTSCSKKIDSSVDFDYSIYNNAQTYEYVVLMNRNKNEFIGKTIKITGNYGESGTIKALNYLDAGRCCGAEIEFVLKEGLTYPKVDTEATIKGTISSYTSGKTVTLQIIDAEYA